MWGSIDRWIDSLYAVAMDPVPRPRLIGRFSFTTGGATASIVLSTLAMAVSATLLIGILVSPDYDWQVWLAVALCILWLASIIVFSRIALRLRRGDFRG